MSGQLECHWSSRTDAGHCNWLVGTRWLLAVTISMITLKVFREYLLIGLYEFFMCILLWESSLKHPVSALLSGYSLFYFYIYSTKLLLSMRLMFLQAHTCSHSSSNFGLLRKFTFHLNSKSSNPWAWYIFPLIEIFFNFF